MRIIWKHKLGDYFTTNDIESVNNKIKTLSEKKKKTLSGIFDLFEEISIYQENQAKLAVKGSGDYEVSRKYKKFSINPSIWTQLKPENQIKKLRNFLTKSSQKPNETKNLAKAYQDKLKKEKEREREKREANKKEKAARKKEKEFF